MAYAYPIAAEAMFEDRFHQFVIQGLPEADVEAMRAAISDMWSEGPGGWVPEWSRLARRYEDAGQPFLASLAYGCAKFPCLADEPRRVALADQVRTYVAASPGFPVRFERRALELRFRGAPIEIPIHLYSTGGRIGAAPVLLINVGVDTWKMDSHRICVGLTQALGLTVLAFDQPGTGETPTPLARDADDIVFQIVAEARRIGNGKVAHLGTSFGANYSALTGLTGAVDAAVVIGAPIDKAFAPEALARLPFGMPDIIANDMGFERRPPPETFAAALGELSRRDLLERADNAPMLVINGADDYFIPQADTLVFQGRPRTEVHLIPDTGHCAFSKLPEVLGLVIGWLPKQLQGVR